MVQRFIYDAENRLVRVEDDLTGIVIAEYGYDPFGRRLWKDVNGVKTYFFYSDEGLIAECDEQGNEIRSYGYQPDSTWTTDPLWLKEGGKYYWYRNDHLGTPQTLVDSAGTVVWQATYTAFGKADIQVETVTNPLRFPGQYYDAETGLHYNWNRYYDPEIGRYTQPDPIGFAGGDVNWYAYVGNNPINDLDPSGLMGATSLEDAVDDCLLETNPQVRIDCLKMVEELHPEWCKANNIDLVIQQANKVKITAGKNFKSHFIDHKQILEKLLGKKYPKFKTHGNEFLDDISRIINEKKIDFVGQGTLKKGEAIMNIYRGNGVTVILKPGGEFVTLLESGKGLDLAIQLIK